jgi:hypothetical protein
MDYGLGDASGGELVVVVVVVLDRLLFDARRYYTGKDHAQGYLESSL